MTHRLLIFLALANLDLAIILGLTFIWYRLVGSRMQWLALCGASMAFCCSTAPWTMPLILLGAVGCWPWSPSQVAYVPGLMLCPGQTAVMPIELPVERLPRQEPVEHKSVRWNGRSRSTSSAA